MVASAGLVVAAPVEPKVVGSPLAASSGTPDWSVSKDSSYEFCDDYLSLEATVQSPTGSVPTDVIGCVNGTNYTLSPIYLSKGKNMKYGVVYGKAIEKPASGIVHIKYYIQNSTAIYDTSNDTVNCTSAPYLVSNTNSQSLGYNRWEFMIEISKKTCATALTVKLDVNGTLTDMVFNGTRGGWFATKDFGCDATAANYFAQIIVSSGSVQSAEGGWWLSVAPCSKTFAFTPFLINQTLSGTNLTVNIAIQYMSWDNTAPKAFFIMVNGVRTNLTVSPMIAYYGLMSALTMYKNEISTKNGAIYGP